MLDVITAGLYKNNNNYLLYALGTDSIKIRNSSSTVAKLII